MNHKILIYPANDGLTKIDVKLENDTLWLTQAQMCALYQTNKSNISEHIKHIFEVGELDELSVVRKFRTTASDGKSYMTAFYNLDIEQDYLNNIKLISSLKEKTICNSFFLSNHKRAADLTFDRPTQ